MQIEDLKQTSGRIEVVKTVTLGALPSPSHSANVEFVNHPRKSVRVKEQVLCHPCTKSLPDSTAHQNGSTDSNTAELFVSLVALVVP